MTGFGWAEILLGPYQFNLEIKSVNHRFLDLRFRLPPALSGLEMELAEEVRKFCERGSLEISLKQKLTPQKGTVQGNTRYLVDEKALESLILASQHLETKLQKKMDWNLSDFLMSGKVLIPVEADEEKGPSTPELLPLFREALKSLVQMREREGTNLKKVMRSIIEGMSQDLDRISALSQQQPLKLKERLDQRLSQWALNEPVEPRRLEWEIALLAEKADITEEIDRLKGHFQVFHETLETPQSVGRKLDFLTQELHREVNTIASKTTLMEITQLTVKLKSQIEKLREQVQNVE